MSHNNYHEETVKTEVKSKVITMAKDFAAASAAYTADPSLKVDSNCYTYALGIPEHGKATPGKLRVDHNCTSNLMPIRKITISGVYNALLQDGLSPIENIDEANDLATSVIAAYVCARDDYHFYRRHEDGTWSHQAGWGGAITNKDKTYRYIKDPQTADRGRYDQFVGYFSLPKNGLVYSVK